MRTCPYCGSQMADDDPFCLKCGAMAPKVPEQQPGQPNYPQQPPYPYTQTSGPSGPPRTKNNWVPVIVITAIVLAAAFAGVGLLSNLTNDTGGSDRTMEYSWNFYYDDTHYNTYTYSLTVPGDYYSKMKNTTIDRTGSSSDVHLSTTSGTVFAVSEYIVVDQYITKVSKDLSDLYTSEKNASKIPATTDLASFIMAFVQGSITYQLDSDYTGGKDSEYWKFPLETLCDKRGDCEDTSILMAALLDAASTTVDPNAKYNAGIFLIPGHAMSAVKASDISPSETRVEGTDHIRSGYYPLESTADDNKDYKIGYIGTKYTGDYFHLYTGYVTSYYGVTAS